MLPCAGAFDVPVRLREGEADDPASWAWPPVCGSPLRLVVSDDTAVDPAQCVASGDGLRRATQGRPAAFAVQMRSASVAPVQPAGPERLVARITPLHPVTADEVGERALLVLPGSTDGNGWYTFEYTAPTAGTYRLHVHVDTGRGLVPIQASPFTVVVDELLLYAIEAVDGATLGECRAHERTAFIVYGRNGCSGERTRVPELPELRVLVADAPCESFVLTPIADGLRFRVEGTPPAQAEYTVHVAVGGAEVEGSPFVLAALPARIADMRALAQSAQLRSAVDHIEASGDGLHSAAVGGAALVQLQAKDACALNVAAAGLDLRAWLTSDDGSTDVLVSVSDLGGGLYELGYTPVAAGTARLSVTLDGRPIQGSPFLVDVDEQEVSSALLQASMYAANSCAYYGHGCIPRNRHRCTYRTVHTIPSYNPARPIQCPITCRVRAYVCTRVHSQF